MSLGRPSCIKVLYLPAERASTIRFTRINELLEFYVLFDCDVFTAQLICAALKVFHADKFVLAERRIGWTQERDPRYPQI